MRFHAAHKDYCRLLEGRQIPGMGFCPKRPALAIAKIAVSSPQKIRFNHALHLPGLECAVAFVANVDAQHKHVAAVNLRACFGRVSISFTTLRCIAER